MRKSKVLNFFIPNLNESGHSRVYHNVITTLCDRGYRVNLFVFSKQRAVYTNFPSSVELYYLLNKDVWRYYKIHLLFVAFYRLAYLIYKGGSRELFTVGYLCNTVGSLLFIFNIIDRVFASQHADYEEEFKQKSLSVMRPLLKWIFKRAMNVSSVVVSVSNEVSEGLRELSINKNRMVVINNPYSYCELARLDQLLRDFDLYDVTNPIFCSAGRLIPSKGFDKVIIAFARFYTTHSTGHLVIFGSGPEKFRLKRLTSKLQMDSKISFLGFNKSLPSLLGAVDIYLSFSRNEGFGNVIVEALAAGKPVIASKTSGSVEILKNNSGPGIICEKRTSRCLYQNMAVLYLSPDEYKRKSAMAQDWVEYCKPEQVSDKYEEIFLTNE